MLRGWAGVWWLFGGLGSGECCSRVGGTAGPDFYIIAGAVALVLGTLLASDYRGWGTRYTRYLSLSPRRTDVISPAAARRIKHNRFRYGLVAVVGLILLVSGIFSL
jgi:hypothetical protein